LGLSAAADGATTRWRRDDGATDVDDATANAGLVWPSEATVLAVAAFCELHALPPGEVCLHVYPFGDDAAMARELGVQLALGTWPP
jgi:hypothetical protein